MTLLLPIRLDAPGYDNGAFAGHTVTISIERLVQVNTDRGQVEQTVAAQVVVEVDAEGNGSALLPEQTKLRNDMIVRVAAPNGLILKEVHYDADKLPDELRLSVRPAGTAPIDKDVNAPSGPSKIKGRVIDKNGARQIANQQLILWGAKDGEVDLTAVAVAKTDATGYFSCIYPNGNFARAAATVSDAVAPYPVRLIGGCFPERLMIAINPRDKSRERNSDQACACEAEVPRTPTIEDILNSPETFTADLGGNCLDITKPNRTLEEFDFYTVVRTTEPSIKGLTLDDDGENTNKKVVEAIGKIVSRIVAQPPRAGTAAIQRSSESELSKKSPSRNPAPSRTPVAAPGKSTAPPDKSQALPGAQVPDPVQTDPGQTDPGNTQATPGRSPAAIARETSSLFKEQLVSLAQSRYGITDRALDEAVSTANRMRIKKLITSFKKPSGRSNLNANNPLDWDEEPTFYQATTIAHGHLLHFRQSWIADGYSLGDLLYSLPLAPGQKKQIATLDWERKEEGQRDEFISAQDSLTASLSRDRDIQEIVRGSIVEHIDGSSRVESEGVSRGGGISAAVPAGGGLITVSGGAARGFGSSESSATLDGSRTVTASSLQKLRDRTLQSAASVRNQRSTVVQTVKEGEAVRAQTEVVANYNHCHAITIEYFEVLRHFAIKQELVNVQECLFVPLMMTPFDAAKALRWKRSLMRSLKDRDLIPAFDALDRIERAYDGSDVPEGSYADAPIEYMDGSLSLDIRVSRPGDNSDGSVNVNNWKGIAKLLGRSATDLFSSFIKDQDDRDKSFNANLGERIIAELVRGIRVFAVTPQNQEVELPLEAEMNLAYAEGSPVRVVLRQTDQMPNLARKNIRAIRVSCGLGIDSSVSTIADLFSAGSRMSVKKVCIGYRTGVFDGELVDVNVVNRELRLSNGTLIETPLNQWETIRPREIDADLARRLIPHLNEHIEHYHRAIWEDMDLARRYMLLDGIIAPNSGGKSVASVVENRLIGVVGNSLILPVVPGVRLDPTYELTDNKSKLHDAYAIDAVHSRVAVPTKGVYAEAVLGACNSCEKKDETRFWRWEESPIPDGATQISPINTDSRRSEFPSLAAKDFGAPLINLQNAPDAPNSTGLASLLQLLGNANSFNDITGLSENQKNALAALQAASGGAAKFADDAAKLLIQKNAARNIDRVMEQIEQAKDEGRISESQAQALAEKALSAFAGLEAAEGAGRLSASDVLSAATDVVGQNGGALKFEDGLTQQKLDIETGTADPGVEAPIVELPADSGTNIIQITRAQTGKERAFQPINDKTGVLTIKARFVNAPVDATVKWQVKDPDGDFLGTVHFKDDRAMQTKVFCGKPGKCIVFCQMRDKSGDPPNLGSTAIEFAVPQFFVISETQAFDQYLSEFPSKEKNLTAHKERLLFELKETAEHFLRVVNVRLIWALPPFNETIPDHLKPGGIAEGMVTNIFLENEQPEFVEPDLGLTIPKDLTLGITGRNPDGSGINDLGPHRPNETIRLFPAGFDTDTFPDNPSLIAPAISEILKTVSEEKGEDPDLMFTVAMIMGRLFGEALAHEVGHALLGLFPTEIEGTQKETFHSALDTDVLSQAKTFEARTGFIKVKRTNPDIPPFPMRGSFRDEGLKSLPGFVADPVDTPTEKHDAILGMMLKHFPLEAGPLAGFKK